MPIVQYGTGQPQGGDYWSQFGPHVDEGAPLSRIGGVGNGALPQLNQDGTYQVPPSQPQPGQWQTMGGQQPGAQGVDPWFQQNPFPDGGSRAQQDAWRVEAQKHDASGMLVDQSNPDGSPIMQAQVQPGGATMPIDGGGITFRDPTQTGGLSGQSTGTIDQLKQLIGSDWSPQHLAQLAPQIKAMGIEIQNQERGDLRPRFRIGGEQWDFGPGGWINSGHGVQPGFGDASQAPKGGMGQPGGTSGGILAALQGTPGYQFTVDEALRGVQSSAAAKGSLLTGGTLKALMDRAAGLAGTRYDTTVDQYGRAAQIGQNAIQQGSS